MKKRNCRRTQEERNIHEEATRLRKMTDAQLVETFHKNSGSRCECSAADFLRYLDTRSGTGNGIGKATVVRLKEIYEKSGARAL